MIKCSSVFSIWFDRLSKLKRKFPKNALVKLLSSSLWGRLAEFNRMFGTDKELEEKNVNYSMNYNPKSDYYVRNITLNNDGDELLEVINSQRPFKKSRELTGAVAMKYIDDVVRIHTDNVTFNEEHDDVLYSNDTMMLLKEDKTTGDITFRSVGSYINHTTGHYTKDNENYVDDDDC